MSFETLVVASPLIGRAVVREHQIVFIFDVAVIVIASVASVMVFGVAVIVVLGVAVVVIVSVAIIVIVVAAAIVIAVVTTTVGSAAAFASMTAAFTVGPCLMESHLEAIIQRHGGRYA